MPWVKDLRNPKTYEPAFYRECDQVMEAAVGWSCCACDTDACYYEPTSPKGGSYMGLPGNALAIPRRIVLPVVENRNSCCASC